MSNPYETLPDTAFWRPAVADKERETLSLLDSAGFSLKQTDVLGTGGSCFAQNIGLYVLDNKVMTLLETEKRQAGQPIFSANYGNIYTPAQLDQLLARAMDDTEIAFDHPDTWVEQDGRYYDLYRPMILEDGFAALDDLLVARRSHLDAVKSVFLKSDAYVFTLGLTEAWVSKEAGVVYPVCPASLFPNVPEARFCNFGFAESYAAMASAIKRMRALNPRLKLILSVSPVPLTATYSDDHVLVATTYSKSVLRAVAGEIATATEQTVYFPSYEIITAPFFDAHCYEANRRTVRKDAVGLAMATFKQAFFGQENQTSENHKRDAIAAEGAAAKSLFDQADDDVICDEEEAFKSIGF